MFFNWCVTRLLPCIQEKYAGKKVYLVLDNARYHKRKCADYLDVGSLNRPELVRLLQPGPAQIAAAVSALTTAKVAAQTALLPRRRHGTLAEHTPDPLSSTICSLIPSHSTPL